jgi:hypothetical protein
VDRLQSSPDDRPADPALVQTGGSVQDALAALPETRAVYARGRLALAIWCRWGATQRTAIKSQWAAAPGANQARGRRARRRDAAPPAFDDLVAEALLSALMLSGVPPDDTDVARLDASRSAAHRDTKELNPASVRETYWPALARAGTIDTLRTEVEAAHAVAHANGDVNTCLECCLAAVEFDPELADRWYSMLRDELDDPHDRGLAVLLLVEGLARHHSDRIGDLGTRWAGDLPDLHAIEGVEWYQVLLCPSWVKIDSLRPHVGAHLDHIASALPGEIERMLAEASSETQSRRRDTDDVWRWLGALLCHIGQIPTGNDARREQAVEAVVDATIQTLEATLGAREDWERESAARHILEGVTDAENPGRLTSRVMVQFVIDLFELADRQAQADEQTADSAAIPTRKLDLGEEQRVILGLHLAARVKTVMPQWSEAHMHRATDIWEALISGMVSRPSGVAGMAGSLVDVLSAALDRQFRSHRERTLFELTEAMVAWCQEAPPSPERLAVLQSRLSRLDDADLRALLFTPVACGWLELGEFERADALAQVAGAEALAIAGFHSQLRSAVVHAPADRLQQLKPLVLDVLLLTPLETGEDALDDALQAWLWLRHCEEAARAGGMGVGSSYLRRLVGWALAA